MTELYKRHRPRRLEKMVGNWDTIHTLAAMVQKKTLPHVLLFHGPSGCGKTTLARILRSMMNCDPLDFKEVNSSSFRGIDTIRDIASTMNLAPVNGPCRIWLIDECHKWTNDAQNAALKMLEDTPSHVYFFLCTTDPGKLIPAIRTRCCEMPVRSLTPDEIELLVKRVAKKEKIELGEDVLEDIVTSAQGSPRMALVLLDKVSNLPQNQQKEAIAQRLAEENEAIELCRALIRKEPWTKITKILKGLKGDPESIRWAVLGYARAVLLNGKDPQAFIVIDVFRDPFYDSKEAGLVAACYEAIFGR